MMSEAKLSKLFAQLLRKKMLSKVYLRKKMLCKVMLSKLCNGDKS